MNPRTLTPPTPAARVPSLTDLDAAVETMTDVADTCYAVLGEVGWQATLTPGDPWIVHVTVDYRYQHTVSDIAARLKLDRWSWDGFHGPAAVSVEIGDLR